MHVRSSIISLATEETFLKSALRVKLNLTYLSETRSITPQFVNVLK